MDKALQAEKSLYRRQLILSLAAAIVSMLATAHFADSGLSPLTWPAPEGHGAVVASGTSVRNQASVWLSTPKTKPQAIDPTKDVTLQFYASFETTDPNTKAPDLTSEQILKQYRISYVLVGRLARHFVSCDDGVTVETRKLNQLQSVQQQLVREALSIPGSEDPGPKEAPAAEDSPESSDGDFFRVVTPTSAKPDRWGEGGWDQPTAIIDIQCVFEPEAFWTRGNGSVLFIMPGLYGDLQREGATAAPPQQRLARHFEMARPDPSQVRFKFSEGDISPSQDDNQTDTYDKPRKSEVGGEIVRRTSDRIWYSDQSFVDRKGKDVFLAGVFSSVAAATTLQFLGLLLVGIADERFARRQTS